MFAARLQGGGVLQCVVLGLPYDGDDFNDLGFIAGQRAGLVQGDDFDPTELFDRGSALDEGALAAGGADGGDHGQWNGDRQSARRGGHQHHQCPFQPQHRVTEQRTETGNGGG